MIVLYVDKLQSYQFNNFHHNYRNQQSVLFTLSCFGKYYIRRYKSVTCLFYFVINLYIYIHVQYCSNNLILIESEAVREKFLQNKSKLEKYPRKNLSWAANFPGFEPPCPLFGAYYTAK